MLRCVKTILSFILVVFIFPGLILAQEHSQVHHQAVTQATPILNPDEVVVTGRIICIGCSLKEAKGAQAQCSLYGHTNALIIEKAIDVQGKNNDELKGKIYQFLHNDQSDKLITEHSYVDKTVIITGKIYPDANILEVNFFKERGEVK